MTMTARDPLDRAALALAAEFRRYDFARYETRDGMSLAARRKPGEPGEGLRLVITPDPDEMRQVLRAEEGSPPGG